MPAGGAAAEGVAPSTALVGTASATGMRGTYTVPNYLIVSTLLDGAGPIAQAILNTSGDATGFGSLPYPGDAVVNAPGLLSVGTGQSIPLSYPFFVQAATPVTPEASSSDPSGQYSLKATANDKQATGEAAIGTGASPSGGSSTSSVKTDPTGKLTVTADASVRGLAFEGVLKIGAVSSHSVTTYAPGDQKPVTKSGTDVEGVTVGGQSVGVGPEGIKLLGQSAGNSSPVIDALNGLLKQANLSVRTVSTRDINGGSTTTALEVTNVEALPVPGAPTGTMVYDIAAASTSIVAGAGGGPKALAPATPVASVGGTDVAAPDVGDTSVAPSTGSDLALGALPAAPPSAARGAGSLPLRTAGQASPLLARDLRSTFRAFYVVVAVGAALLLTGSAVWRNKGVRAQWMPER
jgi:hypothetical protein